MSLISDGEFDLLRGLVRSRLIEHIQTTNELYRASMGANWTFKVGRTDVEMYSPSNFVYLVIDVVVSFPRFLPIYIRSLSLWSWTSVLHGKNSQDPFFFLLFFLFLPPPSPPPILIAMLMSFTVSFRFCEMGMNVDYRCIGFICPRSQSSTKARLLWTVYLSHACYCSAILLFSS